LGIRRTNCIGWHFFAYFFVATDKKVSRHQAKKQSSENTKNQRHKKADPEGRLRKKRISRTIAI